jgi:hypothetical protein
MAAIADRIPTKIGVKVAVYDEALELAPARGPEVLKASILLWLFASYVFSI